MKHLMFVRSVSLVSLLALLGAGCDPFAPARDRIADEVGEAIGEGLLEGSLGGDTDLELGKIPANFPNDVPRYPDAQVASAIVTNEGRIAIMNFSTKDSPEDVVSWFDGEMAAGGFVLDEGIAKLGLFRVYEKDDVKITLQTQKREGAAETAVTVSRAVTK